MGTRLQTGLPHSDSFPMGERAQDPYSLSLWERVGVRESKYSFECTLARVCARGDRGPERAEANASQSKAYQTVALNQPTVRVRNFLALSSDSPNVWIPTFCLVAPGVYDRA